MKSLIRKSLSFVLMLAMLITGMPLAALAEELMPSESPVVQITPEPTEVYSDEPTIEPTVDSSAEPTEECSAEPTVEPTTEGEVVPSTEPSVEPSIEPSIEPSVETSAKPTEEPAEDAEVTFEPLPTEGAVVESSTESVLALATEEYEMFDRGAAQQTVCEHVNEPSYHGAKYFRFDNTQHLTKHYYDTDCHKCDLGTNCITIKEEYEAHDFDKDGKCEQCGYMREGTCEHADVWYEQTITYAAQHEYDDDLNEIEPTIHAKTKDTLTYCIHCESLLSREYETYFEKHNYNEEGRCRDCGFLPSEGFVFHPWEQTFYTTYGRIEGNDLVHEVLQYGGDLICTDCGAVCNGDQFVAMYEEPHTFIDGVCACGYQKVIELTQVQISGGTAVEGENLTITWDGSKSTAFLVDIKLLDGAPQYTSETESGTVIGERIDTEANSVTITVPNVPGKYIKVNVIGYEKGTGV